MKTAVPLSFFDQFIGEFDRSLRVLTGSVAAQRPIPQPDRHEDVVDELGHDALNVVEKKHAAGLMRINHVGEVCAQALYQSQKLATHDPALKQLFEHAAQEEEDHLHWTLTRIHELGGHPSLLNPLWYTGAFAIGLVAGTLGNAASLGFMAETERQVEQHLDDHLTRLPKADQASRAILEQMRVDEISHSQSALQAGGNLPSKPVSQLMRVAAKIMTTLAYRI